jgi:hypothetical protein
MTSLWLRERLRALYRRARRWQHNDPACHQCGRTVSLDTGFTIAGTLADNSEVLVYCPDCAPPPRRGYTLADIQQIRWRPVGNPQPRPQPEGETVTRVTGVTRVDPVTRVAGVTCVTRVAGVTHEAGGAGVTSGASGSGGSGVEPEEPLGNRESPGNPGAPGSDGAGNRGRRGSDGA